jgi:hypothetical protein
MRGFLAIAVALTSACVACAAEGRPAHQSVQFDGNVLVLAWEGGNPGERIKEYIPNGQTLETWTKLASIRRYDHLDDPQALAGGLLKQLKKNYPLSPSSIIENPKTGEVIVDFIVWPEDGAFVEFNVFKYGKDEQGKVVAQQYALRAYENQEEFLKRLRPERERLVELMTKGLQTAAAAGDASEVKTGDAAR